MFTSKDITIETSILIHNVPEYAANYPIWVVRNVDNQFWFYGAYSNTDKANAAAQEINGLTFTPHFTKEVTSS